MPSPYRISAKLEPDAPEEVDAYEASLRARAAWSRRLVGAACGAVTALSVIALAETPPRRHPADLHEARAKARLEYARTTIATARTVAEHEQATFAATLEAALQTGLAPEPSAAPCPLTLPEASRLVHGPKAYPLLIVEKGDRTLLSPSVAALLADVNRADEHLAEGRYADAILHADALSTRIGETEDDRTSNALRYDVVLLTSDVKRPVRVSQTSFEPGEIRGRVYVYDFGERRVTCAGDVHASSSRRIEYDFVPVLGALGALPTAMDEGLRFSASLEEDFEVQVQRAIARSGLAQIR